MDPIERLNSALAGQYVVEREVGAGGMATVYLAEDCKHHRKVAIKVLRDEVAESVGAAGFLREIEIAVARLRLFAAPFAALHAQPGMVENWFPELLAKVRP